MGFTPSSRGGRVAKRSCKSFLLLCAVLLAAPASFSDVVISELMYHPASNAITDEFIELYNTGVSAVDLTGWTLDGVALLDGVSAIKDDVLFRDEGQWPVTPDGLGRSLAVIDPEQDNSTRRSWRASTVGSTPGVVNSVDAEGLPAWIDSVLHTPDVAPLDPIVVTATVLDATTVELFYKLNFEPGETTIEMRDDGASNDGGSRDGVYGPVTAIPGQAIGNLMRYRTEATGSAGGMD